MSDEHGIVTHEPKWPVYTPPPLWYIQQGPAGNVTCGQTPRGQWECKPKECRRIPDQCPEHLIWNLYR